MLRSPVRARLLGAAVLVLALATPATASAGIVDSLRGWWPMWEGRGQTVFDWSGRGNNGQLGATAGVDDNDPAWTRGFLGSALSFGGNDFVRIPATPDLDQQQLTVSAWVRAPQSPGLFKYVISRGGESCTNGSAWALSTMDGGGLGFYVFQGNEWVRTGTAQASAIWNGKWHHVAGTYDGVRARLFVDGQSIGDSLTPTGPIVYDPRGTQDGGIGAYLGACDLAYTGDVAQVAVFGEALPVDQIYAKVASYFPRPLR